VLDELECGIGIAQEEPLGDVIEGPKVGKRTFWPSEICAGDSPMRNQSLGGRLGIGSGRISKRLSNTLKTKTKSWTP